MEIFFDAEKDGVTERELKAELVRLFDSFGGIEVAYLVLGHYDDNPQQYVFLCLLMKDGLEDVDLVNRIHEIFSRIFSSQEHLDVYFFYRPEEHEIRSVCRPFYELDRF
jgi:SseB protein C-terminal domain